MKVDDETTRPREAAASRKFYKSENHEMYTKLTLTMLIRPA